MGVIIKGGRAVLGDGEFGHPILMNGDILL